MTGDQFDRFSKLVAAQTDRRSVLKTLAGGALTVLGFAVAGGHADAAAACATQCRAFTGSQRGQCQRTCLACQQAGMRFCAGTEGISCCAACEFCDTERGLCFDSCDPGSCTQCDPIVGQCVSFCTGCQVCGEEGQCAPCGERTGSGCCTPAGDCLICAPDEFADCTAVPPTCVPQPV